MKGIWKIKFNKYYSFARYEPEANELLVLAISAENAINKARNYSLRQKGESDPGDGGDKLPWKVTKFELTGLELVATADM